MLSYRITNIIVHELYRHEKKILTYNLKSLLWARYLSFKVCRLFNEVTLDA